MIGQWGSFSPYAIALVEPFGPLDPSGETPNGDFAVAYYTNGSWGSPYYGGYAGAISVEGYTTAALAANTIYVITFD